MSKPAYLYWYKAEYVSAYDGDTIKLNIDLGFNTWINNQTIRLYGINTPEIRGKEKERGKEIRDYVRKYLTEAQDISVKTYKDKKGKYGRWLGEIFIDGENLNELLVEMGYAERYMV